ncbi:hypothetical protein F5Y00DRAFT_273263 [Daldinia vernicosa]|uniref:uncharacterized protein n=1 Tax=Daldinia vernicosa TaxID=114800 RepID=UPI002007A3FB|nr:uncharacterized protein F5Y00DRAFT_273263 [Daldinia vernicosa]KAI0845108.1 hypothetical protein F5Y00DRAFT_273263 [Daldinia vernicosa]
MSKPSSKFHQIFSRFSRSKPKSTLSESTAESSSGYDAKYGLQVLADQPSEQIDGVDIVAVHGLNGHYIKTWSAESSDSDQHYNWLQSALPQTFPTARIMSFGYDSAVFTRSVADIGDFADQLLHELKIRRSNLRDKNRPVLFLCHSLGGIIFKKALIRAHERDHYKELLSHVRGVAFFGTPHQGSSAADWAVHLFNVLKAAFFNLNINTAPLKDLKNQSERLFQISLSFVDRCNDLKIVSFYETQLSQAEVMCLQELYPCNYEALKNANEERAPGTCEWLLQHAQYQRWKDEENSSLLWVSANAGCGKSTLARFIIDHLEATRHREGPLETICYFFFKEGTSDRDIATIALRAILHQIFLQNKVLMDHILDARNSKGSSILTEFNTLTRVFEKAVSDPRYP